LKNLDVFLDIFNDIFNANYINPNPDPKNIMDYLFSGTTATASATSNSIESLTNYVGDGVA
jgi:hypothetical protein